MGAFQYYCASAKTPSYWVVVNGRHALADALTFTYIALPILSLLRLKWTWTKHLHCHDLTMINTRSPLHKLTLFLPDTDMPMDYGRYFRLAGMKKRSSSNAFP